MNLVKINLVQLINSFLRRQRFFQTQTNHLPGEISRHVVDGHAHVCIEAEVVHGSLLRRFAIVEVPALIATKSHVGSGHGH